MAERYRLTRIDSSNGPHIAREVENQTGSSTVHHYDEAQRTDARQQPSGHGWRVAFIGLVVVLLVLGVGIWMNGVSGSLGRLNQTAVQNSQSIAHANAQLSNIQIRLQMLGQQLSQLSAQITMAFHNVMQAIHGGRL